MREDALKILWISIPEKIPEEDEHWISEAQQKSRDLEQIIRNFVLRHPEILKHPTIIDSYPKHKMEILGVELGLVLPDESTEHPDVIFRKGGVYYVVEVKTKINSEPSLKRTARRQYEALKYTLETTGQPFDRIIPVVVFGDESSHRCIRSRYHASFKASLEELERKIIESYPCICKKNEASHVQQVNSIASTTVSPRNHFNFC